MRLRSILFWTHLAGGVTAGVIILLMSFTGVLLTYERQVLAWADSGFRSTPAPAAAALPLDVLLERVRAAEPKLRPTLVTVRADVEAPVTVGTGQRTLFVDAYSGAVLGESSRTGIRAAMSTLREWHRWLALSGDSRTTGRAVTGWSNLIFLVLVCSGAYLWLPRRMTWSLVRNVAWFRSGLSGKARDFNWHNTIGIWCLVPLFFVVLTAMPISFPWANAAVYRMVGEEPPRQGQGGPQGQRGPRGEVKTDGLEVVRAAAARQVEGWRSLTIRPPVGDDDYVVTIDRGDGGQPHLRDSVTLSAAGTVVKFEPFADQSLGRKLRSISRFTHTGEVLGLFGQTIAGIASAGGVVLVWTGLALAWRRFFVRRQVKERKMAA
jgi:uncharacterized iron-regulated membrane protein